MMPQRQLAQMVTDAMEEACPDNLMQLTQTGQLVDYLTRKIQAFKLQFVREMEGKPYPQAELMVMESLMPMLIEFKPEKNPRELTQNELNQVATALDQFEAMTFSDNSPAERSAAISD